MESGGTVLGRRYVTALGKYTAVEGMENLGLLGVCKVRCESLCAGAGVWVLVCVCVSLQVHNEQLTLPHAANLPYSASIWPRGRISRVN